MTNFNNLSNTEDLYKLTPEIQQKLSYDYPDNYFLLSKKIRDIYGFLYLEYFIVEIINKEKIVVKTVLNSEILKLKNLLPLEFDAINKSQQLKILKYLFFSVFMIFFGLVIFFAISNFIYIFPSKTQ